ncbi:glutamate ABC transporter substrate-binding protein [Streptomyces sp. NRRL F-5123]|uniref:glutamate ABC transporter substrate-binding protein n=1 Tax=Streptomyces sp. NRRL F-5123 TaxID=1463856 RepID=UPI0005B775FE|nr:glutamate ABC transporter substrate-binding protein [Streptomyces sp. NRRL F-5123]
MTTACALAVAGTLIPLQDGAATDTARSSGPVVRADYADASDNCSGPVPSLDPASGSIDGAAVEAIKKRGRLRVGVDQNSYLWGFRDPATGQFAGFDIDIVKAIAKDILGNENAVQYLTVPTAMRIEKIKDGSVDMVIRTMTISCARATQVAFSAAYFSAGQQILSAEPDVTGYNDSLKGKTVCTAKGSTGEDVLNGDMPTSPASLAQPDPQHGAEHVLTPANQLDCLVLLQLHQADAVFTDNALAAGQAAQDPTVHLKGGPVTVEPYGVAMKLGDDDLVRRVNKVLAAYIADGRWAAAYNRWLVSELPDMTPPTPLYK